MWIEISSKHIPYLIIRSRLARALWIEMQDRDCVKIAGMASRLARALWIEIHRCSRGGWMYQVEARESLVD